MIAVQFVEGVDFERRSDLVWFPESGIDPSRILIYFAWPDHQPADEEVIKSIEAMGIQWICLNSRSSTVKNSPVWAPGSKNRTIIEKLKNKPTTEIEKWIYRTGDKLIKEVNYWLAFYEDFRIRIHFIIGGSDSKYMAQGIAFDLKDSQKGFIAGKERSELHWPPICILGWYPVDVFFTWTPRAQNYLVPNVNRISSAVATGYSNDLVFSGKRISGEEVKKGLRARGANYVIALFDNVHGSEIAHSTAKMEKFYLAFLEWLLEDPGLGIVIKSKKPSVIQRLPRVRSVLEKAEFTGRCLRLSDEHGRLPVDASLASDLSIGVGISSAIIEAAIAGCRSIHADLTHLRSHEFYQWGYERIIFDDLDRLLFAIKGHKSGLAAFAEVGDWTPFLGQLDPFRDGQAGRRMGTYLRGALQGFDQGLERNEVLKQAGRRYAQQWGEDKVIFLPTMKNDFLPLGKNIE
jgi:hypothetical protein